MNNLSILENETLESYGRVLKFTSFSFELQSVPQQPLKNLTNMVLMFYRGCQRNRQKQSCECNLSARRKPNSEIKKQVFVSPKGITRYSVCPMCFECSFPFISFMDSNVMVHVPELKIGENCTLNKLGRKQPILTQKPNIQGEHCIQSLTGIWKT